MLSSPVLLTIEPTLQCNANCIMCNRNAVRRKEVQNKGFLSWSTLIALRPFIQKAETVLFSGFGEPLLHPEYIEMIRYIKNLGPEIYFYTNGACLNQAIIEGLIASGVDFFYISFGGATPETYRKIRGVEMEPIIENLHTLKQLRGTYGTKKPLVYFNIVAMNSILPELDDIIRIASDLNVSGISMPNLVVQRHDLTAESPWLDVAHSKKILMAATETARKWGIEFHPPELNHQELKCYQFFNSMTVSWDGLVLSCPLERYILGSIKEQSPGTIWNSPAVKQIRRQIFASGHGLKKVCPNCFCWDNRAEAFLFPHVNSRIHAHDLRKKHDQFK
jgi:MoaA/NifB/PqqE/SkfB family radical SAM enzyme